ncbi:unnamed protein product [Caenorhabditis bovis]|uniref:Glutamate-rich WD repeat-containing protein 1 n=1 Tax=Caenorhabditis bovis TaxID=2654633 RepID=A0A8S1EPL5_9PELO|nr:unnamed protein product [Caenorhabditis bovis]
MTDANDVEMKEEEIEDESESEESSEDEGDEVEEEEKQAYIPGLSRPLKKGEGLDFDPSVYKVFHTFTTDWPCLSFDVVPDGLGENRTTFPAECYIVSGTQAEKDRDNEIVVMGLKNLSEMRPPKEAKGDDSDTSEDESEDEDEESIKKREPIMHGMIIPHFGSINRVRAERLGDSTVCACWNAQGRVQIWNITEALNSVHLMKGGKQSQEMKGRSLFTHNGTGKEGYGLAWSSLKKGDLATGDIIRKIFIWQMKEGGEWAVGSTPLTGHKKSIEDLAWSPTENGLLASCSSDQSIKLWDTRANPKEACVCTVNKAHDSDVNVISWNRHDNLIVSGGDDGELKIWSLKTIQFGQPVARFKYHSGPITSVEWHPQETTTFMASSEDDQTTIWDIATEADGANTIEGVPPQLMFVHMGQKEVKEVHWHPQIPGLAINTSIDGFNVFKTINI